MSKVVDTEAIQVPTFSDLEKKVLLMKEESGDEVCRVVDCRTGRPYILKQFHNLFDSYIRSEIRREFQILKNLDHPNIVKCCGLFEIGDRVSLLLEYTDHRCLDGAGFSNTDNLAIVAYQVLLGLDYLHDKRIPHGEIKPSNIWMNLAKDVKVLYLGKFLCQSMVLTGNGGAHDEFSWDLWNLGLTVLKLYKGGSDRSLSGKSAHTSVVFRPSQELWRFLQCCMGEDLSQGWTAHTLLAHPFFKDSVKRHSEAEKAIQINPNKEQFEVSIIYGSEIEDETSPKAKKHKISVPGEDSTSTSKDSTERTHFKLHGSSDYFARCIQHCSLFLPDCEFEKDKLIQMWVAEDCIEVKGAERAEDAAGQCFDTLVDMEVIIPTSFNRLHREWTYRIDQISVRNRFPDQCDYFVIDEHHSGEIPGEASHLLWKCGRLGQNLSHSLKKFKQLRTLRVVGNRGFPAEHLSNYTFLGLKDLRTLDLSHGGCELPGSIGTMKSLRYLDVSDTPIKQLPESIAGLSHLQTLKLRGCVKLHKLPENFWNLKKLRHLDLDVVGQLRSMPKRMGNLTDLQTLKAFLVGQGDGYRIDELEKVNEITGPFCITGLENVLSVEEAKKAALSDKTRINELVLRWNDHENEHTTDTTGILECLQPHFGLRELTIICFSGSILPAWINNPSFANLSSITLIKCPGCHLLPSFGELPSLETLHILEMENVRDVSTMFPVNSRSGAFPKLEKLKLDTMNNLEEWSGMEAGDLPCLREICIRHCPKLSILPPMLHLYSLQRLELSYCKQLSSLPEGLLPDTVDCLIIKDCPMLRDRCDKGRGPDWFKIAFVKEIWIDFDQLSID